MSTKADERYLRVYCLTHKISFTALGAGQIICESGGEALAQNYPHEECWEYCCDCQSLWPSDLAKAGQAKEQCLVCSRQIKRRYLCHQCQVMSLDSDELTRGKAIAITSRGEVEPGCPGCARGSGGGVVRRHECAEAGVEFSTARESCPFCDEQIAGRPSFPALASEYLEKIRAKKLECTFEPQKGLFVAASKGEFVLIPNGKASNPSILLPKLTRFAAKQDFYSNYKDYYDCDDPAAGEVLIVYPAIVDQVEGGWKVREVGRLRVKNDLTQPEETAPEDETLVLNDPGLACPNCATIGKPEHVFCKECGYRLQPEYSVEDSQPGYARPIEHEENEFNPPTVAHSSSGKALAIAVPLIVCLGIVLLIVVIARLSGKNSIESKLENAIAKGNLISPPGESAYDYYQQLKREGAGKSVSSKFDNRLLPMLTSNPQQLIADSAKPESRDVALSEWEEASKLLSWASEIKPGDNSLAARAAFCAGRVAFSSKRSSDALNHWKRASELDTSWALPVNGIGLIYLREYKDYPTARGYFEQAIKRDSSWAVPYHEIGLSFYLEKKYDQAQPYYQQAADHAPQWALPHAALGNLAKRRGDYHAAKDELERALKLASETNSNIDRRKINEDLEEVQRQLAAQSGYLGL